MSITVTGIPSGYATPGDFVEINFGVGPFGAGAGYGALLIANRTSAGSGTDDTVVYGPNTEPPLQSEADVIAIAGPGSEAHREWRRFRAVNKTTPLSMILPADAGGTAATATLVLANASAGNAVLRIWVGDEAADTSITNGMAVDTLGAAAVISVNNKTHFPVTVAYNSSTDTFTFTAKNTGPRGNEIRIRAAIVQGTTATTVTPNNVSTAMTGGATSDSWTSALATILPTRYYYIVSPSTDVTGNTFDDLVTQVLAQAQPAIGIRQRVFSAAVGSQSAGSTVAANSGINSTRVTIPWLQTPDWTAGEIAAQTAAVFALFEDQLWSYNFRDFGKGTVGAVDTSQFWKLPASSVRANWPTATSIETALNNGLMAIGVTTEGVTYITRQVTTKHKSGSNFDYRARDSHIGAVLDRWVDELVLDYAARFGAKNFMNDVNPGEPLPSPNVVTPRQIKSLIFEKIDKYAGKYLKDAQAIKDGTQVVRNSTTLSRCGARVPMRVVDLLLQNDIVIDDNSTAQ